MITSSGELRQKAINYCLNNNLTVAQINNITREQVLTVLADNYFRAITGGTLRTIKAECIEAIRQRAENEKLAIVKAKLVASYPDVVCERFEVAGYRKYVIWPNGKPPEDED